MNDDEIIDAEIEEDDDGGSEAQYTSAIERWNQEEEAARRPEAVAEAIDKLHRAVAEAEEAMTTPAADASTALVPTTAGAPALNSKRVLANQRSLVIRKRAAVEAARKDLERVMEAQMSAALEVLRPMQDMVKRLEEGIWTVNLYLGRDEEIVTLAEGEHAPADTPITLRQMVLSMDQESMVAAEYGGIDARSIEQFDEWLTADPAHLTQVLPEPKGVVVLVPRMRQDREYGDPWLQTRMDEANRESYWLIRNGDAVYRMRTDFRVGRNLIPLRDEFASFFRDQKYNHETHQYETVDLEPGSTKWLDAEKAADDRQRHYMRVGLILQGLVDRTTVFHPLPAEGISFLHPESYDAGYLSIVADADPALGTGREPFDEWLSRLNAQLRPGMRVMGAFNTEGWRYANNSEYSFERRVRPNGAQGLETGALYTIEGTEPFGGGRALVIRFQRTDKQWKEVETPIPERPGYVRVHHDQVPYEKRATALLTTDDTFILPFDLVTVPEMEAYINARTEREHYISMVPLLKAAIAAKKAEAEAEAPFRLMLAGVIAANCPMDTSVTIADVEDRLPELVDWWKLANRWHRPLIGNGDDQAKAVRMITDEFFRRLAAERQGSREAASEEGMVAMLKERYREAILIARKRDGSYVVFEPADDRKAFVHRITLDAGRQERKEWVLPGTAWRKWRILWAAKVWEEWDHAASLTSHLTGPEVERILAELQTKVPEGFLPLAIVHDVTHNDYDMYCYKPTQVREPAHLLTGTMPNIAADCVKATPGRGRGMKLEVTYGKKWVSDYGSNRSSSKYRVDDTHVLVWESPENQAKLTQTIDKLDAIWERRNALSNEVRDAEGTIAAQWEQRATEEAYARFMEDYADPDLWEGHRSTLKGLSYPHWTPSYSPGSKHYVRDLLVAMVERGVPMAGHTVAEVQALWKKMSGKEIAVPDDVLDLVIFPDRVAGGHE